MNKDQDLVAVASLGLGAGRQHTSGGEESKGAGMSVQKKELRTAYW